ncbi:MAG: hypothetical protein CL908_10390 [Deltaproteobacteria bacterium]|nr:hypothetical protein [Deltaproteobacteria bacterium]
MSARDGATGIGPASAVADVMTREVATLDANDNLSIADDVMALGRIRHMPVVDADGSVVGIVSQRDLLRGALARALGYGEHAQKKLYAMLRVKEVMSYDVVTLPPSAPLREAARMMTERKIGSVVVVEGEKVVGILTEGDFVRLVNGEDDLAHAG